MAHPDPALPPGRSFPLGATPLLGGVQFRIYARGAAVLDLVLFDSVGKLAPSRLLDLRGQSSHTCLAAAELAVSSDPHRDGRPMPEDDQSALLALLDHAKRCVVALRAVSRDAGRRP
ncbi:MAG: hypothetical protein QNK04_05285 [Myxococcota bacterium]|nr:hypothetical protein [Myxococcota bacterium]